MSLGDRWVTILDRHSVIQRAEQWAKLSLLGRSEDPLYRIQKIAVKPLFFPDRTPVPEPLPANESEKLEISIDDPQFTGRCSAAFRYPILVVADTLSPREVPDNIGFIYWGNLTIVTGYEIFEIGITSEGFVVGTWLLPGSFDKRFYSLSLATIIDELYFSKTGHHLPEDLFSRLSGEAIIEHQRKAMSPMKN